MVLRVLACLAIAALLVAGHGDDRNPLLLLVGTALLGLAAWLIRASLTRTLTIVLGVSYLGLLLAYLDKAA
jgi:LPXTG-motif cell wall-anchored protein